MSRDDNTTLACIYNLLQTSWYQIKASWLGSVYTLANMNFWSYFSSERIKQTHKWRTKVEPAPPESSCFPDQRCMGSHIFLVRHVLPGHLSSPTFSTFSHATYMLAHYLRQIIEQHRLQAKHRSSSHFTTLHRQTRRGCHSSFTGWG